MSDTTTGPQQALVRQGPFSPDRYGREDAALVGLPSPEGLNLLFKFAEQMVGTPFVPKGLNGQNPAGNILAVIMTGREEGFQPMEALRSYWMSPDGRLAKYADALMTKMRRHGFKFPEKEFTAARAHLKAVRPDGEDFTSTLTMEEIPAFLRSKDVWKAWPQRMLKARVIGDVYRFLASDLGGPTLAAEELMDESTIDGAQKDLGSIQSSTEPTSEGLKVELKRPAAPIAQTESSVPSPAPPAPAAAPTLGELKYGIACVFVTGDGREKPMDTAEIPQAHPDTQVLRAQAMANDTGLKHIVYTLFPDGQRANYRVAEPPTKKLPAPAQAPAPAADKPAAATAPAPTSSSVAGKEAGKARLMALIPKLPGAVPEKTALTRFNTFMQAYAGVDKATFLKLPADQKIAALEALECVIEQDANEFLSGPEQAGSRRKKWDDEILVFLRDKWPGHEPEIALAFRLARKFGQDPNSFKMWYESSDLDMVPMEDARAFLRCFLRTREAAILSRLSKQHNLSIAAIVSQIEKRGLECSIEEASPAKVEAEIKTFRPSGAPTTAPAPAAATPVATAPAAVKPPAEEEPDNLFD